MRRADSPVSPWIRRPSIVTTNVGKLLAFRRLQVRRHLGVETQRQWAGLAILRTTPVMLGLFALVTRLAHPHLTDAM